MCSRLPTSKHYIDIKTFYRDDVFVHGGASQLVLKIVRTSEGMTTDSLT